MGTGSAESDSHPSHHRHHRRGAGVEQNVISTATKGAKSHPHQGKGKGSSQHEHSKRQTTNGNHGSRKSHSNNHSNHHQATKSKPVPVVSKPAQQSHFNHSHVYGHNKNDTMALSHQQYQQHCSARNSKDKVQSKSVPANSFFSSATPPSNNKATPKRKTSLLGNPPVATTARMNCFFAGAKFETHPSQDTLPSPPNNWTFEDCSVAVRSQSQPSTPCPMYSSDSTNNNNGDGDTEKRVATKTVSSDSIPSSAAMVVTCPIQKLFDSQLDKLMTGKAHHGHPKSMGISMDTRLLSPASPVVGQTCKSESVSPIIGNKGPGLSLELASLFGTTLSVTSC